MIISMIAAKGSNNVIGKDGKLPWFLPADLKFFKQKTMGHHVLMGRKTYDSLEQDLEGRKVIIVSTKNNIPGCPDCKLVRSIGEGIKAASKAGESELFIAGGGTIYKQALNMSDKMYLTEIDESFEGDAYFPEFDQNLWEKHTISEQNADQNNKYNFRINEYSRKDLMSHS